MCLNLMAVEWNDQMTYRKDCRNQHKGSSLVFPTADVDKIHLRFIQHIGTKPFSIFYTLIPYADGFLAFYRHHYSSIAMGFAVLDEHFQVLRDHGVIYRGEDPRSFIHRGEIYLTDNFYNANKIIRVSLPAIDEESLMGAEGTLKAVTEAETSTIDPVEIENRRVKSTAIIYDQQLSPTFEVVYGPEVCDPNYPEGKNLTYLSDAGVLYQVRWFYPLEMYCFDENIKRTFLVYRSAGESDNKYRGGTPGYATAVKGEFVGFGHYTITENGVLRHLPFVWKLNVYTMHLETRLLEVQPLANIMDPVGVVCLDHRYYLITAESDWAWFCDQDYITRVWEILFE